MSNQSILLAHAGIQYSLHLARELHRYDHLSSFHTCLAIRNESHLAKFLSPIVQSFGLERQWQNRQLYGVPAHKIYCYPSLEIQAWWRLRQGIPACDVFWERNDRFQQQIPDGILAKAKIVIGFDTSSHILAAKAQNYGQTFILDRSVAHPRTCALITEEIRERFPDWKNTWDSKLEYEVIREETEHKLAKIIVVPSKFVANSLLANGIPKHKIRINPFGTYLQYFYPSCNHNQTLPLIFLYVGLITARKGLPLLLQAWQKLKPNNAELWIVGPGKVPNEAIRQSPDSVRWLGPVSRQKLPSLFHQANVFVFPSFLEGLAQVQVEAAACGLPIIATTASGGEEIIEEGHTGFIIQPGNLEQLMHSISKFLDYPILAKEMSENARKKVSCLSWNAYGDRWQKILQEVL